jgi:hypothetical protein
MVALGVAALILLGAIFIVKTLADAIEWACCPIGAEEEMTYRANPVVVEAFVIASVGESENGNTSLLLENGGSVVATAEMQARCKPSAGDYWVIQSDGYVYLNPRDVFERKYSPCEESGEAQSAEAGPDPARR